MRFFTKASIAILLAISLSLPAWSVSAVPGDLDGDGRIDLRDAIMVLQALSRQQTADPFGPDADLGGDGRIGLAEAIHALQRIAGLRGGARGSADLEGLLLSSGTLTPPFAPGVRHYTATVASGVFQLSVTPITADPAATTTVNGGAVPSGTASPPLLLDTGGNTVVVVVTASDQSTGSYTIDLYREPIPAEADARLSELSLSSGNLDRPFHPDITDYEAAVGDDVATVKLTATTVTAGAHLMVNGAIVESGLPSAPIPLVAGRNDPIPITVISANGSAQKSYLITITRGTVGGASPNAFLAGLSLSGAPLNEPFFAGRLDYSATVPNGTATVTLSPLPEEPGATVRIDGSAAVPGEPPPTIPLSVGTNRIVVAVTAPDGRSARTYAVTVRREAPGPSGNAMLASLALDPGALDGDFAPGTLLYRALLPNHVEQTSIRATTIDRGATLTVNGQPVAAGQPSPPIALAVGENTLTIQVTAADGVTSATYLARVLRHGATAPVAALVFVVDPPAIPSAGEFDSLPAAIAHLSQHLAPDETGEVRVKSTRPMEIDEVAFDCNVIITLERGASNVINGPGTRPISIRANGALDVAGLHFINPTGVAVRSGRGLSVAGSRFSGDTTIEIESGITAAAAQPMAATRPLGTLSADLSLRGNQIDGGITIHATAASQKEITITDTAALSLGVNGSFTGRSFLNLSANPVGELVLNLQLRDDTQASVEGHLNLDLASTEIDMAGAARFDLKSSRIAELAAGFHGLKGAIRLENTVVMGGSLNLGLNDVTLDGIANSYTDLTVNVGYSDEMVRFGLTEKGGYAYKTFRVNAPEAPANAEITLGFDNFRFNGDARYQVAGKASLRLENGTVLGAEGQVQFRGNLVDARFSDLTGHAKLFVEATDPAVQFNLSASRVRLADDFIAETASANISGQFDEMEIARGIMRLFRKPGGARSPQGRSGAVPLAEERKIAIRGLRIGAGERPTALMIDGFDVPVTIEQSEIRGQYWAVAVIAVDADVTIRNNASLAGGVMLDGDPEMAGRLIARQYTVSRNTITQSTSGGSCLSSHAIRDLLVDGNTMQAAASGAHGVLLYGGKAVVRGGTVVTPGPPASQALAAGGSAGGHNGILHAEGIETITGAVQAAEKGWLKLTGNTFANAKVADYKLGGVARLLADPVASNSGLNRDEDILGSLIDWDNDSHRCPDYPSKCNDWDDDAKKCGCDEDGVQPPQEPGI